MTRKLSDCPSTPNCICSTDRKDTHRCPPLDLGADPEAGWATLVALLEATARTRLDVREDDYVHAVVRSRVFRFRDDVELLLDRTHSVAHVRSASRLGLGDFGVNRARIKQLRHRLAATLAQPHASEPKPP